MFCPQEYTPAGFELQIGTNHFGHFALVQQLIGKMQSQVSGLHCLRPGIMHLLGCLHHRASFAA